MRIKRTRSVKIIAMAQELGPIIEARKEYEKREKELKEFFRDKLGIQDAELQAGQHYRVISKLCSRMILDPEKLKKVLGDDLSAYEKESEYTEISVQTVTS